MSEWKTYRLGKFADINPKVQMKQGGEYSFVEMKDLNSTLKFVLPSAKRELKGGSKFQNGDTLFARITPCLENGKICQVKGLEDEIGFGSTEFLVFRGKKDTSDTDFVYYLTRTEFVRNNAVQMMTGTSGRQRVEKSALAELEILAPENIHTQQQIASILSSLDDKIELNLQMNQTLEAMAQAIFKDWFVNFNFPGFDGELVDGLPKGWKMGKLNEIAKIEIGRTPPRIEEEWFSTDPKDIKWISIKDLGLSGVYIFNTTEYLTQEAVEKFRIPIIPENTVVLSFKLTIGRLAITTETMLSNEAIAQIKSENYSSEYIYTYLKTYNWGTLGSTSSIATAINSKIIKEMEVLIPDMKIEKQFQEVINPIFEKLKTNSQETETLTQIRDSLLPKLMTGKIEIRCETQ